MAYCKLTWLNNNILKPKFKITILHALHIFFAGKMDKHKRQPFSLFFQLILVSKQ
jgi:hypothetical protein